MTTRIAVAAAKLGFCMPAGTFIDGKVIQEQCSPAVLGLRVPKNKNNISAIDVVRFLKQKKRVLVSARLGAIRISPSVYNTDEEVGLHVYSIFQLFLHLFLHSVALSMRRDYMPCTPHPRPAAPDHKTHSRTDRICEKIRGNIQSDYFSVPFVIKALVNANVASPRMCSSSWDSSRDNRAPALKRTICFQTPAVSSSDKIRKLKK